MRENNLARSTATTVYITKLTVSTKHSQGIKHLWGKRQPYELRLPWKSLHTCRFLLLTPGVQRMYLAHLSQLSQLSHICLPCLPNRWISFGVLYPIMLWWFCWCSDWPKVKNLWHFNLKLQQTMRNLACADQ